MFVSFFMAGLSIILSICSDDAPLSVSEIPLPQGYERTGINASSFGTYLRNMPLKKEKTVYLYNGTLKWNQSAQYAVINVSTGTKDLQQCADAVMRLRAEYLKKRQEPICFADMAGKKYCWSNYQQKGWQNYLETVFGMCGTFSLEKQLMPAQWEQLKIGDVIIKGGSPGHAVIVMDMAQHRNTGKRIFLLAQSYMPAQDIHLLINPKEKNLSPWYSIPDEFLMTPEWTFKASQLRTWP